MAIMIFAVQAISKAYGHYPNATEYFSIVNNTTLNDAQVNGALMPSKIICNASPTFCSIYLKTYAEVFPTNAPYYAGRTAGAAYADSVIKKCHFIIIFEYLQVIPRPGREGLARLMGTQ
ncbi:MAG: hypothetical protein WA667_30475 [Candidatus Nitrosopolaris sp.]